MKGHLHANISNREILGVFVQILHISFIFEIFQILLTIKNHKNITSSKLEFDLVYGKVFKDTYLRVI